uniref:Uncharacterized protein n=1 Tax=Magnetococcus massalia (strain MO-1) TaxID=451514 RepID=A0A1S7LGJ8_MAGMO|nr:Conserved exported protein of unknown function [Candidatus Magnetococcus massalia]
MLRALLRMTIALFAGLLLFLALLVGLRVPLLEWAAPRIAIEQGYALADFKISRFDHRQLQLKGFQLTNGHGEHLSFHQLVLDYSSWGDGPFLLSLIGLRSRAELLADGQLRSILPASSPSQSTEADEAAEAQPFILPPLSQLPSLAVEIRDATLELKTPQGDFQPRLQLQLSHTVAKGIQLTLRVEEQGITLQSETQLDSALQLSSQLQLILSNLQPPAAIALPWQKLVSDGSLKLNLSTPLQPLLNDPLSAPLTLRLEHDLKLAQAEQADQSPITLTGRLELVEGEITTKGELRSAQLEPWLRPLLTPWPEQIPQQATLSSTLAYGLTLPLQEALQGGDGIIQQLEGKLIHQLAMQDAKQGSVMLNGRLLLPGKTGKKAHMLGAIKLNQFAPRQPGLPESLSAHGRVGYHLATPLPTLAELTRGTPPLPQLTLKPHLDLKGLDATGSRAKVAGGVVLTPGQGELGVALAPDLRFTLQPKGAPKVEGRMLARAALPLPDDLSQLDPTKLQFDLESLTIQLPKRSQFQRLQLRDVALALQAAGSFNAYDGELTLTGRAQGALPGGGQIQGGAIQSTTALRGDLKQLQLTPKGCWSVDYDTVTLPGELSLNNSGQKPLCLQRAKGEPWRIDWSNPKALTAQLAALLKPHRMDITVGHGETAQQVQLRSPTIQLKSRYEAGLPINTEVDIHGGRFRLGDGKLLIKDLALKLGIAQGEKGVAIKGDVENLTLRPILEGGGVVPLHYKGELLFAEDAVRLEGRLQDRAATLPLDILLEHDLEQARGVVSFQAEPQLFLRGGRQPQQMLPLLKAHVTAVSGELGLSGHVAWGGDEEDSHLEVQVKDWEMETQVAQLDGLNLAFNFASLNPPRTDTPQKISLDSLNVGIPLHDIEAALSLGRDGVVTIDALQIPLAGGEVFSRGGTFDLQAEEHRLKLQAKEIDLALLAKLLRAQGVEASGRLHGQVPVRVEGGRVWIDNALLKTDGGGVIRHSSPAKQVLEAGGEQPGVLAQALENLHYKQLSLGLSGDLAGDLIIDARAEGFNPDLYDGFPLEINFSIQGALGDLYTQEMQGFDIPAMLKREGVLPP